MLFNSYTFIFGFLPLVVLGFALCTRCRARQPAMIFLAGASLVFYGWWNWHYLFLLLFSIAFNYGWGLLLHRRAVAVSGRVTTARRVLLAVGMSVNLGVLAYFKYADFLISTVDAAFGWHWELHHIMLPLAVSFFTFEQITYLVDAYFGAPRQHDFLDYALFITLFPRLIAGPIIRPREILPQLTRASTYTMSAANLNAGLLIFAIGLFKKVMIADAFSPLVGPIFDRVGPTSFTDAWGATLAFTLQIYFDFSGYSDMAIGLALLFNIKLPENFDSPYQARNIIDFWRRWHITLSSFLRDYLYIPLGGNRKGTVRRYVNLMITMGLGGLWHGASWTFVLWGALHGAYLTINHLWQRTRIQLPSAVAWPLTFVAVMVGWVFFRAHSMDTTQRILAGMVGLNGFAWDAFPYSIGRKEYQMIVAALVMVLFCPNRQSLMQWEWTSDRLYAIAFTALAALPILRLGDPTPFVYFQF